MIPVVIEEMRISHWSISCKKESSYAIVIHYVWINGMYGKICNMKSLDTISLNIEKLSYSFTELHIE